jgi:hypothetical protein
VTARRRSGVNRALTKRPRREVENPEFAALFRRLLRAWTRRAGRSRSPVGKYPALPSRRKAKPLRGRLRRALPRPALAGSGDTGRPGRTGAARQSTAGGEGAALGTVIRIRPEWLSREQNAPVVGTTEPI